MKTVICSVIVLLLVLYSISLLRKPLDDAPFFKTLTRDRPIVVAHRGGAMLFPENTLPAFTGAIEMGADVLELDIWLTADSIPVVLHDDTIDRTTDGSGHVNQFTLDELQTFDAGYRFSPADNPALFPYRGQGIRIPALRQIFEAFPDTHLFVEVKENRRESAESVIRLVHEFDRWNVTLGASFHHHILEYFRENAPGMVTHASEKEVIPFLALSLVGLEGLISPNYQAFIIPKRSGRIPVATRRFIRAARKRNLFVGVWTINEPNEMKVLIDRGANAIITDRPDVVLDIVDGRDVP